MSVFSLSLLSLFFFVWVLFLSSLIKACHRANLTDWGSTVLNLLDGLNRLFCWYYHGLNKVNISIDAIGPAIVISNHVSGLDPLLLIASVRRPLRFLIAKEQYERFGLNWLFKAIGCIPVDRGGRTDKALREAIAVLEKGEVIALFPHGKIHLDTDSQRPIKGGAAALALKTRCDIYPVRIFRQYGEGYVVVSVLIRALAKLTLRPVIQSKNKTLEQLKIEMTQAIE